MGILASLFLREGVNHTTLRSNRTWWITGALRGIIVSLVLTGFLANWLVGWTRLSGFGAEEAGFLQVAGVQPDLWGLLLFVVEAVKVVGAADAETNTTIQQGG